MHLAEIAMSGITRTIYHGLFILVTKGNPLGSYLKGSVFYPGTGKFQENPGLPVPVMQAP